MILVNNGLLFPLKYKLSPLRIFEKIIMLFDSSLNLAA